MVLIILLLVKKFKIYVSKSANIFIFSIIFFFLNVDSLFNIGIRLLKFSVIIIDTLLAGTVSQIFLFRS